MSSIVESIQKKGKTLPISSPADQDELPGLRRRLSSLSLNLSGSNISMSAAAGAAKMENAGSCIKKWWEMGWGWVMSRKPSFVQDLEMSQEEKHFLGYQYKGSLMHLFFKVKYEVRKLLRFDDMTLPQTQTHLRYDRLNNNVNGNYSRNSVMRI
ncbi:uncharacterized protein LOC141611642 [Silene latifolia]|uniref:uncharacterized protein LOC141611642 n=1 Tax=Silene latifolia TaxID=37657 RepID=UPI003D78113B